MQVEHVGRHIRDLRLAADLTGEQLAVRAGISSATLSRIENGQVAKPGYPTLLSIAQALGFNSVDEMMAASEPRLASEQPPEAIAASVAPGVDRAKIPAEDWIELRRVMREVMEEILEERGVIEPREHNTQAHE